MTQSVIETNHLTKYFGSRCAVDQVTLSVPRGQVVALLGRNGSGKTTLLRMLLGFIPPTRGTANVLGEPSTNLSNSARARIGYMAETHPLYTHMTVKQIAQYQSRFYPRWHADTFWSVTRHFHLAESARLAGLSRGEQAGVSLAITLAPSPELLILDDPALGLDPVARRLLLEAMVQFTRDQQRTILFSSHLLADIERVADRVAILDRSILRVDAPVETFRSRIRQWVLLFDNNPPADDPFIPGLLALRRDGNELRLTLANADDMTERQLHTLGASHVTEIPVGFEDAVLGYLGDRGNMPRSFEPTTERGAA